MTKPSPREPQPHTPPPRTGVAVWGGGVVAVLLHVDAVEAQVHAINALEQKDDLRSSEGGWERVGGWGCGVGVGRHALGSCVWRQASGTRTPMHTARSASDKRVRTFCL